jgi:hypothetical protein
VVRSGAVLLRAQDCTVNGCITSLPSYSTM